MPSNARRPGFVIAGVAFIPLTRGMLAVCDAEDLSRLDVFKWSAVQGGKGRYYAVRSVGSKPNQRAIKMHRAVMGLSDDDPRKVDHRNGDSLDNRKSNLRACTHAQNLSNARGARVGISGFRGVRPRPNGRWRAVITVNRRQVFLGDHPTAEIAAAVRDRAAQELHGEFAVLNSERKPADEVEP